MGDGVSAFQLLTLVVAIVGAVTGVGSLIWTVASHVLSGGRVQVQLKGGWILPPTSWATVPVSSFSPDAEPLGTGTPEPVLVVEVTNVGRLPVSVLGWSFAVGSAAYGEVGGGRFNKPLPHRLEVGEEAMWTMPVEDVAAFARAVPRVGRIKAQVRTGRGMRGSRESVAIAALEKFHASS